VFITKLNLNSKSEIAGRAEYYMDKNQVIIPTATPNGFQTFVVSNHSHYGFHCKVLDLIS
jgi:hypothetical protein